MAVTRYVITDSVGIEALKEHRAGSRLLGAAWDAAVGRTAPYLGRLPEIPGQGDGGSPAHLQHQNLARVCEDAGWLFRLTEEPAYGQLVGALLAGYADRYLRWDFQVQKNTNPPGRIFHQILSEHLWLAYASIGYGFVRESLDASARQKIEGELFRPMVEMFTVRYRDRFDIIHNHGLWASAAVGLCGLALRESAWVDLAVDGQFGDRKRAGYLAQLDQLFSPSGYYVEGPYYHRFAIRPLLLFSDALAVNRPDLDLYARNGGLIGKIARALLATAYPDGRLPALNDSSRSMGIEDEGLKMAVSVCHARYGGDDLLVGMAGRQGGIWLHPSSIALGQEADRTLGQPPMLWPSVELSEGPEGTRGAQGILRMAAPDGDVTQAVLSYGQHGMGHGHFDMLGLTLFSRGSEVLREYGYGRWVNLEPKFGGRYLKENETWAKQTLAHNAVVVDRKCQNQADSDAADQIWGRPHFFVGEGPVQAMSAFAEGQYPGVTQQRTVVLVSRPGLASPLVVDLCRLTSLDDHEYDYVLQYSGQICGVSVPVRAETHAWKAMGTSDGYQHLFDTAQASVAGGFHVTWLQDGRFNSWFADLPAGTLHFAQLGAQDPDFNLRREPSFLLRTQGKTVLFASAFEAHGSWDEALELSRQAHPQTHSLQVLGHDAAATVVEIQGEGQRFYVAIANNQPQGPHRVSFQGRVFQWNGPVVVGDLG